MANPETFTIAQAFHLTGISTGMIDYLCRTEVIKPSHSNLKVKGKARLFTFSDILILRTIKVLTERGIKPSKLKDAFKSLRKKYPNITSENLPYRYLVTDGKWAFLKNEDDILENLNKSGQLTFSFVIDMQPIQKHIFTQMNKKNGTD